MEQYPIQRDVKALKTWVKVDNNGMTNLHLYACNNQFRPLLKQKVKHVNISFCQTTCMSKLAKSIIACNILKDCPFIISYNRNRSLNDTCTLCLIQNGHYTRISCYVHVGLSVHCYHCHPIVITDEI